MLLALLTKNIKQQFLWAGDSGDLDFGDDLRDRDGEAREARERLPGRPLPRTVKSRLLPRATCIDADHSGL